MKKSSKKNNNKSNKKQQRNQKSKNKQNKKEEKKHQQQQDDDAVVVEFDMTSFLSKYDSNNNEQQQCKRHGLPKRKNRRIQNVVKLAINSFMLDTRKDEFRCTEGRPNSEVLPSCHTYDANLRQAITNLYHKFPQIFKDSFVATCLVDQMIVHGTNILLNGTNKNDWLFAETLCHGIEYLEEALKTSEFRHIDWGVVVRDCIFSAYPNELDVKRFFTQRIKCECIKSKISEGEKRLQQQKEDNIISLLKSYSHYEECKHGVGGQNLPNLQEDLVTKAAEHFMVLANDFRVSRNLIDIGNVMVTLSSVCSEAIRGVKDMSCLKDKMIVHGTNILIAKGIRQEDLYFARAFAGGVTWLECFLKCTEVNEQGVFETTKDFKSIIEQELGRIDNIAQFFAQRIKCNCLKSTLLLAGQPLQQQEQAAFVSVKASSTSSVPLCYPFAPSSNVTSLPALPLSGFGSPTAPTSVSSGGNPFAPSSNTTSLPALTFSGFGSPTGPTSMSSGGNRLGQSQQQHPRPDEVHKRGIVQHSRSNKRRREVAEEEDVKVHQPLFSDVVPSLCCSHNIPEPPPHIMSLFEQDESSVKEILPSHCSHNVTAPPKRITSMFYQNQSNIVARAAAYFILVIHFQYNGNAEQAFEAMKGEFPLLFQHNDAISSLKDCMVYEATSRILDKKIGTGYSDWTIPRHLAMGVVMLEDYIENYVTNTNYVLKKLRDYTGLQIVNFFCARSNCSCLTSVFEELISRQPYDCQPKMVTSSNEIIEIKRQLEDAKGNVLSCSEAVSYAYMNYVDSKDFGNSCDANTAYSVYQTCAKSKQRADVAFEILFHSYCFDGSYEFLDKITQPSPTVRTPLHSSECRHSHLLENANDYMVSRAYERYSYMTNTRGNSTISAINDVRRYFPKLFKDDKRCSEFKAMIISLATQRLLCNDSRTAKHHAVSMLALEHIFVGPDISKSKYHKGCRDIYGDGERGVTIFFAKRSSSNCLNEIYNKVKNQRKMGQCLQCKKQMKFKKLLECARCGIDHYCSKACQTSHWPEHKPFCSVVKAEKENLAKKHS